MKYQRFIIDIRQQVALVKINRPEKANALDDVSWRELKQVFEDLDQEASVRAIVLAGEGKHFCAGIDKYFLMGLQSTFADESPGHAREKLFHTIRHLQSTITAIELCRKPVLAAIHAACLGAAVDIVTACDMRYATADAYFSVAEIDLGIVADLGTLQRLPKVIPQGIARELVYTGRRMEAQEAFQWGLVNKIYADQETMLTNVMEIAEMIASKSPLVVRGCKTVLNYARDHSVAEGLMHVAQWNSGMLLSDDLTEAMMATLEKRTPNFRD